jgi:hypothetical protein
MSIKSSGKNHVIRGVILGVLCSCVGLQALDKRLEVSAVQADIHMQPNIRSAIIATLSRGEVLILASSRKFKREWNYVYFPSPKNGTLRAGYVRDSSVTKLYQQTRSVSFSGNSDQGNKAARPEPAVDGVRWGMLSDDLIHLSGEPLRIEMRDGAKILSYKSRVMDRACRIEYTFFRDRLTRTRYIFTNEYAQKIRYIEEYLRINDFCTEKYGRPHQERKIWHDPVMKDDPNRWGQAVSLGQLSYQTLWQLDQTEIHLKLAGSDFGVTLELLYSHLTSH